MRLVALAIGGLALALLGCTADEASGPDETASAGAPAAGEPTPAPLPAQALRGVAYSEPAEARQPESVLILPFLNRSKHRIHPGYLQALDQTLAVEAESVGLRPVRPEIAHRLAADLGLAPGPWGLENAAEPTAVALERSSARVGAGAVVWGEIRADRSLALHATAYHPESSADRWDGFTLPLEGAPDEAFYDAPRRLLEGLAQAGRIPRPGPSASPGTEAESQLAAAMALASGGDPARLHRAEQALVALATEHPGWSQPWVRLAWLRAFRGALRNSRGPDAGFLVEVVNPARHMARRFDDLSPDDRARLDAIDHLYLVHLQTPADLAALLDRAPLDARVLLAHRHPDRDVAPFRLAGTEGETDFERTFAALAAARGTRGRMAAVATRIEGLESSDLLAQPYLSLAAAALAQKRGDWGGEYRWRLMAVPAHGLGFLEILRERCSALPEPHAAACSEPVRALAERHLDDAAPLDPRDADAWEQRLAGLGVALLSKDVVAEHPESFLDLDVFRQDGGFAQLWLYNAELIAAANGVLEAYDAHAGPLGAPGSALLSDARSLLRDHLGWLLYTAYQPAFIGMRRGQKDEALPYLEAMGPFSDDFPVARFSELHTRSALGFHANYTGGWGSLAKGDLYDDRWVGRWLATMRYNEGKAMSRSNGDLLAGVVPNNHTIARFRGKAWVEAEDFQQAVAVLEAGMGPLRDPSLTVALEDAYAETNHPVPGRTASLEASVAGYPHDPALRERLAKLYGWTGRPEDSERLWQGLLAEPNYVDDACKGIARVIAYRDDAAAVERHFASCLAHATDQWRIAKLHHQLAGMALHRDDYDGAVAELEKAHAQIGGAAYVLGGLGFAHELAGRYEQAEPYFRRYIRVYPRILYGYDRLATLQMRRGDLDAARAAILEKKRLDPESDQDLFQTLGRIHHAQGDFAGFEAFVAENPGLKASQALSNLYYWMGDYERELAFNARARQAHPDEVDFVQAYHRALVDLGRFAEAKDYFDEQVAEYPYWSWAQLQRVRIAIGLGDVTGARKLADAWVDRVPLSHHGVEMRFRVAHAEGNLAQARQELARARGWAPRDGGEAFWDWYFDQLRWLKLEAELGLEGAPRADLERMAAQLEAILHRVPHDMEAWPLLAAVRTALGDPKAAAEARTQAARWNPPLETQVARKP